MSSSYGWLSESTLVFRRPVPLEGVPEASIKLLSTVVRKRQRLQQQALVEQKEDFAVAQVEGRIFSSDPLSGRRWTRPTSKARQKHVDGREGSYSPPPGAWRWTGLGMRLASCAALAMERAAVAEREFWTQGQNSLGRSSDQRGLAQRR